MSRLFKRLAQMIFPVRCPFCRKVIPKEQIACTECNKLALSCKPLKTVLPHSFCVSPFPYSGIFRRAVLDLKFRKKRQNAECMAVYMARIISECLNTEKIDCVTSVPLSKKQLRQRGFNQAQVLAEEISEILNIPYKECLVKTRENQSQHRLSKSQRMTNVNGVYKAADNSVQGLRVLIIDDIITTGYTLDECCKVLKKADCQVFCSAFCKTEFFVNSKK